MIGSNLFLIFNALLNVPRIFSAVHFFCPFLEKTREKIHFRRYFRALNLQPFNALSNSELLILCT